jgi:hypothetical protein
MLGGVRELEDILIFDNYKKVLILILLVCVNVFINIIL